MIANMPSSLAFLTAYQSWCHFQVLVVSADNLKLIMKAQRPSTLCGQLGQEFLFLAFTVSPPFCAAAGCIWSMHSVSCSVTSAYCRASNCPLPPTAGPLTSPLFRHRLLPLPSSKRVQAGLGSFPLVQVPSSVVGEPGLMLGYGYNSPGSFHC